MENKKNSQTFVALRDSRLEAAVLTHLHEENRPFERLSALQDILRAPMHSEHTVIVCELDRAGDMLQPLHALREHAPLANICVCGEQPADPLVIKLIDMGIDYFLPLSADDVDIPVMLSVLDEPRRPDKIVRVVEARPGWYSFAIPARSNTLARMYSFLNCLLSNHGPEEQVQEICTVIDELFSNSLEWGIKQSNQQLSLSMLMTSRRTIIKVEDGGDGFQVETTLEELNSLDFELLNEKRIEAGKRPGGFGLRLVHELASKVIFNKKGNGVLVSFEH